MAHIITLGKPQHLQARHPGRRDGPTRLGSQRTVGIVHPHPQTARLWMGIHKADTLAERGPSNNGIRIEQQDVFALRLTDGHVVGAREAQIVIVCYQLDPRVTATDMTHSIIGGGIVNDKHLDIDAF